MELTHSYKQRESGLSGLGSSVKRSIVTFINEHPEVFEALARTGSPFGGSCFSARQETAGYASAAMTRKQLVQLQLQLEALTDEVVRLTARVEAAQLAASANGSHKPYMDSEKQIGINRFRALQAKSHSLA